MAVSAYPTVPDQPEPADPTQRLLLEAKERFKRSQDWENGWRRLYIDDTKFRYADADNGWQWPDAVKEDRDQNNRPCLTINRTSVIVEKLANESKKNRPEPRIKPVGEKVSYDAAQVWQELIRHIEYISNFEAIFGTAKENQLNGGLGYWHIVHDYVDDESFDQELKIEPLDPMNVYLDCDLSLDKVDGSDSMWAFIFKEYNRKEFRRLHPDIGLPMPARSPSIDDKDDWIRNDAVRVAEYYRIVVKEETLIYIEDESGTSWTGRLSEIPKFARKILDEYSKGKQGIDYKERDVKDRQLEWYKILGDRIIDEDKERKGHFIPIVRMPGREKKVESRLHRAGIVRALKDPQRMYNYNDLSLDTPLPVPGGWTTMGAVQVGDVVLSDEGKPTAVVGISPTFINRKCYQVRFDDGSDIVAGEGHLWTVEERGKRKAATWDWSKKTITTAELVPERHFIWATKPLQLSNIELPLHPYVLGAWLGDGNSYQPVITSGFADADAMQKNLEDCGYRVGRQKGNGCAETLAIYGIRKSLKALNVLSNKHIPAQYLRSSQHQREQLLQGLMDTDGCCTKQGQCVFVTISDRLAEDFAELLHSLGIKASFTKTAGALRKFPNGKTYQTQESYRFAFSMRQEVMPFGLARKQARLPQKFHARRTCRHRIISITEVPSVPTKCLVVDAPSHLFLAGPSMVPTHNSSGEVEVVALQTKTPWVVASAAVEGNETAWAKANTQNAAYLAFRHVDDEGQPIPPPARAEGPTPAQGFLEGLRIAASEMELASGIQVAQQVNPSLERTPMAIEKRHQTEEVVNFDFVQSEMLAIRHTAVLLMDLAPHIYDTARVIQTMAKDGTIRNIEVNPDGEEAYIKQTDASPDADEIRVLFNPKIGKFAIEADVGPAYQTQREAAWDAFIEIIKARPELMEVMGDLGFRAGDFPLANEIAERLKRNIAQNMPWLLDDSKTGPMIANLQQENANLSQQVQELMVKLAENRAKSKGKEELRDLEAMGADDNRLTAVTEAMERLHNMGINENELRRAFLETKHQMDHDWASLDVEKSNQPSMEQGDTTTTSTAKAKGKTGSKTTTTKKVQKMVPKGKSNATP
jgi:hypothetical protein